MANFSTLKAAINAVIKTNGQKEITGEVLNQVLNAMVTSLGSNYQFAGVATPSTNPGTPDQNVFYMATEAGTYTNFNATVLPAGISILLWNGSWSHETFFEVDSVPTSGSDNLISSGAVFEKMKLDGGAYDVSAHNSGATFASLSALLSSENLNTLIPVDVRHGGMSIKFVQSDDNKYGQARCMAQSFTTDVTQWQGVDDEPTAGSKNLVESGGVVNYTENCLQKLEMLASPLVVNGQTWNGNAGQVHLCIPVEKDDVITYVTTNQYNVVYYLLLESYATPVRGEMPDYADGYTGRQQTNTGSITIPNGANYLIINDPFYSDSSKLTSLKKNGIEVLGGIWGFANGIYKTEKSRAMTAENNIKTIAEQAIANNSFSICHTGANTAAKAIAAITGMSTVSDNVRLLVKFLYGNTADNVTFNGKVLYYRGIRASSTNYWNAGDILDIRYSSDNDSYYAEPYNDTLVKSDIVDNLTTDDATKPLSAKQGKILKEGVVEDSDLSIIIVSNNIANPSHIFYGMIDSGGNLYHFSTRTDWAVIEIPLTSGDNGKKITFGGFYLGRTGYAIFRNGDTNIGSVIQFNDPNGTTTPKTVTVPSGCDRLYIDIKSDESPASPYDYLMVNYGESLLSYDAYENRINKINGINLIGDTSSETSLNELVVDLPISDGTGIEVGYAYIDSSTGNVKIKLS